ENARNEKRGTFMLRRAFLYGGLGALAGCAGPGGDASSAGPDTGERHRWRMVTSWPPNFPGFGESANRLARRIETLSGGRLAIEVFAAGELVPAFQVFDTVSRRTVEMGHSFPTCSRGVPAAAPRLRSVPFGPPPHGPGAGL